jgi:hypothetical protein
MGASTSPFCEPSPAKRGLRAWIEVDIVGKLWVERKGMDCGFGLVWLIQCLWCWLFSGGDDFCCKGRGGLTRKVTYNKTTISGSGCVQSVLAIQRCTRLLGWVFVIIISLKIKSKYSLVASLGGALAPCCTYCADGIS